MGQSFWYRSGDIWLPPDMVRFLHTYIVGSDRSLFYLNYWHINHFFSGVLFALFHSFVKPIPYPLLTYIALHTVWEAWQLSIGMTPRSARGALDILVDTVTGTLGYLVTDFLIRNTPTQATK